MAEFHVNREVACAKAKSKLCVAYKQAGYQEAAKKASCMRRFHMAEARLEQRRI